MDKLDKQYENNKNILSVATDYSHLLIAETIQQTEDTDMPSVGKLDDARPMDSEQMETDDIPSTKSMEIDENYDDKPQKKHDEKKICISRILNAFWADYCDGQIITENVKVNQDEPELEDNDIQYNNLTSQVIVEIAMLYYNGKRFDYKQTPEMMDDDSVPKRATGVKVKKSKSRESLPSTSSCTVASCPTPLLVPFNPADQAIIKYLIGCHDRCNVELSNYTEPRKFKEYGQSMLDMIYMIKEQIVRYSLTLPKVSVNTSLDPSRRSPFLDMLYEREIPSDYLQNIICEAYKKPEIFSKIFGQLINNLFTDMQAKVTGPISLMQIDALNELFNVTLITEPAVRPICNLVGKLFNFYPTLFSPYPGREITKTSYLGPFLSLSVFAEENFKLLSDEDKPQEQSDRFQMVN